MEEEANIAAADCSEPPPAKRCRTERLESAGQEHEEDDVFDFGGDLGPAAYEDDVDMQGADAGDHAASSHLQCSARLALGPVCAAVSAQPGEDHTAAAFGGLFTPASLYGIEDRLSAIGEVPRFREFVPGRLPHHCTTTAATVDFWPSTLKWSVSGDESNAIERSLIGDAACSVPPACACSPRGCAAGVLVVSGFCRRSLPLPSVVVAGSTGGT